MEVNEWVPLAVGIVALVGVLLTALINHRNAVRREDLDLALQSQRTEHEEKMRKLDEALRMQLIKTTSGRC